MPAFSLVFGELMEGLNDPNPIEASRKTMDASWLFMWVAIGMFFTTAINSSEGGDMHSAEAVRHKIKLLVDNESPKSILSDDKIVKILRDDGVEIARRTVAKYRDSLKIPSSVERRRMKRAAG